MAMVEFEWDSVSGAKRAVSKVEGGWLACLLACGNMISLLCI